MAVSQDDNADRWPVSNSTRGRVDTSRDEIDLNDYFEALWRRKYFVVFSAACPALLVWLFFFFSPRDYNITYTYDIGPDAKSYQALLNQFQVRDSPNVPVDKAVEILRNRFYCVENLDKLAAKLRENGFEEHASNVSPTTIQLEGTDTILALTITSKPARDVRKISSIIRDNLENVIPMYSVEEQLSGDIAMLRTAMADIEENKFSLELELESKKTITARLKALVSTQPQPGADLGGLVLHFENARKDGEYLPLSYQIQATDANIINMEQTIRVNQEKYDYCGAILSLKEGLLEEVRNKISSYYTIGQFHSFLAQKIGDYEGSEVKNYLSAYIKKVENAISANKPVIENPRISSISKNSLAKAGVVFVGLLMMTTFVAFLLEAAPKDRNRETVKSF